MNTLGLIGIGLDTYWDKREDGANGSQAGRCRNGRQP
jgi:hypothetical protein